MARLKRRLIEGLALGVALLLILGIVAPFVHADRYRERMQSSLSSALGRSVWVDGHISFSLFTGPALALDDVKIAEADGSREPFAYVDEVRAVPRLYSLWTGRLEFSSLTLDGAHVNLVRGGTDESPSWNFEPLLRPGLLAEFPVIHMRDSRINFVLDGRKSPFYLLGVDLDVAPRSSDGSDWSVRFAGAPARSDRPAHGFGAVEASGSWKRTGEENGRLALDLKLERSELSDILALLYGRNAGIHGIVSGKAHVAGLMSELGIEGEVGISELHGWDQSAPSGGVFPFRVSGTLNASAQHLELYAQPRAGQPQWMLHLGAESYLEKPSLKMEFRSEGLPIALLPALLHNFGANVPEGLQLAGMVNGAVAFDSREGWSGSAVIPEVTLAVRGSAPLKIEQVVFSVAGTQITSGPVEVTSGVSTIAEASAAYSIQNGAFQVKLVSADLPLSAFSQRFPGAYIPFLSDVHSGVWSGDLTYSQGAGEKGSWHGEGSLTGAAAAIPSMSQPLSIDRAHLHIEGEDIQLDHMAVTAGTIGAEGDYSYSHSAPVPHQFHIVVRRADLPGIEAAFHPLLNRSGSLIDLALGRSPAPKWLLETRAAGAIQIGDLDTVAADFSRFRANIIWDGTRIALTGVTMHDGASTLSGTVNVELKNPKPRYSGSGTWNNPRWKGGSLSGTVAQFETSGSGLETVANLKARGDLKGKNLNLAPLGDIDFMTASYTVSWGGSSLRVRIPVLRLDGPNGEVWTGSGGALGADGEVTLTASGAPSAGRQVTLAGSIVDAGRDWVER